MAQESVKIRLKGYLKFKRFLGGSSGMELEMKDATLQDVLDSLSSRLGVTFEKTLYDPETKQLKRSNMLLLNGQSYLNLTNKLNTELRDGDEIVLLPVITGG